MKSLFVFVLIFVCGLCIGGMAGMSYTNPCAAILQKEAQAEQQMRDFLTNNGKAPEWPVPQDRGL